MSEKENGAKLWHYLDSDQKEGPVTEKAFIKLFESGSLPPETLVWTDGLTEWQEARTALPKVSWPSHHGLITTSSSASGTLNLESWVCVVGGGAVGFLVTFNAVSFGGAETNEYILAKTGLCILAALVSSLAIGLIATLVQTKRQRVKEWVACFGQKILTTLALAALLYVWKGEQDRLASEKKEWETFSAMKWEKPYVPDYVPLVIKFFLVGCCYTGLMFVFKTPKRLQHEPPSGKSET